MNYIDKYPFVVIFFLLIIFFVFVSMFSKIKIIKAFSISIISIIFVLLIVEIILSFSMYPICTNPVELYNKTDSYFPQKKESYKVSEILLDNKYREWFLIDENYVINKNKFVKNNKIIFEAIYTIDTDGLRYTKSNKESKDTFLFLGCSLAFGACVNDNETLPYCFSENLGFSKNIINLGRDARGINWAYSILASNDYIESLLGKSKIKYVFYEYICDHKQRAFRYKIPSDVLLCEDGVEHEVEQPCRIIKKYFTKCLIYERFFSNFVEKYSDKFYYKYIQKIFLKMYNISKQRYNAEFVVIMWNNDDVLEKYFEKENINFIKAYEFLDYLNDIIKDDGHPNVNGNRKIADLLINYLKSKGEV